MSDGMPVYAPESANAVLVDAQKTALSWVRNAQKWFKEDMLEVRRAFELDQSAASELIKAEAEVLDGLRELKSKLQYACEYSQTLVDEPPVSEDLYLERWAAWDWIHQKARWDYSGKLNRLAVQVLRRPVGWPGRDTLLLQKLWEVAHMLSYFQGDPLRMLRHFKDIRIPTKSNMQAMYLSVALFRKERSADDQDAGREYEYYVHATCRKLKEKLMEALGGEDAAERWLASIACRAPDESWCARVEEEVARYAGATQCMFYDVRGVWHRFHQAV